MSILGYAILAFCIGCGVVYIAAVISDGNPKALFFTAIVCIIIAIVGGIYYFGYTASGSRYMVDTKSELMNGLDRTVTVYTADGQILAQYEGKIDLQANEGGYVKFDFDGKRYIYYNCFVETIANIR